MPRMQARAIIKNRITQVFISETGSLHTGAAFFMPAQGFLRI